MKSLMCVAVITKLHLISLAITDVQFSLVFIWVTFSHLHPHIHHVEHSRLRDLTQVQRLDIVYWLIASLKPWFYSHLCEVASALFACDALEERRICLLDVSIRLAWLVQGWWPSPSCHLWQRLVCSEFHMLKCAGQAFFLPRLSHFIRDLLRLLDDYSTVIVWWLDRCWDRRVSILIFRLLSWRVVSRFLRWPTYSTQHNCSAAKTFTAAVSKRILGLSWQAT